GEPEVGLFPSLGDIERSFQRREDLGLNFDFFSIGENWRGSEELPDEVTDQRRYLWSMHQFERFDPCSGLRCFAVVLATGEKREGREVKENFESVHWRYSLGFRSLRRNSRIRGRE